MKILITGATGFVGFQLTKKLIEAGHAVVCAVKNVERAKALFPQAEVIFCDFNQDHEVNDWLPRLQAIDVVINCVGIFFHKNKEVLWNAHYKTPKALYSACEKSGVKRIIQISALGIENYKTAYAESKKAAENFLQQEINVPYFILKPSFIYGPEAKGGMALLRSLAACPGLIPLPGKGNQPFQPIYVNDLVAIIISLLDKPLDCSATIACVSEKPITLREILIQLSQWLGWKKRYVLPIPFAFLRIGGVVGSLFASPLINKEAITMLNTGSKASMEEVQEMERLTLVHPQSFTEGLSNFPSTEQDKWHAKLFLLQPLLRLSLAVMWIISAITSYFFYKQQSYALLGAAHIPATLQPLVLNSAAFLNLLIGFGLLFNFKTKELCVIQVFVILFYTLIISLFIPYYWLEPFGPIAKNIPILVSILILFSMES